jgi:hypothetical protein
MGEDSRRDGDAIVFETRASRAAAHKAEVVVLSDGYFHDHYPISKEASSALNGKMDAGYSLPRASRRHCPGVIPIVVVNTRRNAAID